MRKVTLGSVLVVMLMMLSSYGAGTPAPQQSEVSMQSMTAAELEKAGDLARAQKNYHWPSSIFGKHCAPTARIPCSTTSWACQS